MAVQAILARIEGMIGAARFGVLVAHRPADPWLAAGAAALWIWRTGGGDE